MMLREVHFLLCLLLLNLIVVDIIRTMGKIIFTLKTLGLAMLLKIIIGTHILS